MRPPEKRIVRLFIIRRRAAAINRRFLNPPVRALNVCWILENMFAASGGNAVFPV
jgi:hypothetical protein